jgi:hypothetical protein
VTDPGTYASATIQPPDAQAFREFVVVFQDDINFRFGSDTALFNGDSWQSFNAGDPVPLTILEDPEDSGQKAFNYKSEPLWLRMGYMPGAPETFTRTLDYTDVLSNSKVGANPETPLFLAGKGQPVRFRVLQPGGHPRNHVFHVHGHVWQELPYTANSTKLGDNKNSSGQWLSNFEGARGGHGPFNHFDALLQHGAGGRFGVTGDYLYRNLASFLFDGGQWGLFRVLDAPPKFQTPPPPKPPRRSGSPLGKLTLGEVTDEVILEYDHESRDVTIWFQAADYFGSQVEFTHELGGMWLPLVSPKIEVEHNVFRVSDSVQDRAGRFYRVRHPQPLDSDILAER